jgi:hydroxyethylthiazole kinase
MQEGIIMIINEQTLWDDICRIRDNSPLIHNITNYVVMNTTANAILSVGASPVMAHAPEEVDEMIGIAGALVINIGTLSDKWIQAMLKAGKAALSKGVPVVLDPVGAGATKYRTKTAQEIVSRVKPAIIRGNASEILALARAENKTKGVDSTHGTDAALNDARELAAKLNCTISISGETDIVLNPDTTIRIKNGHLMMPKVTGLGCTASALSGVFSAVNKSPVMAAAHAMATMGICGEMAAAESEGPGSLQTRFIDALYNLNKEEIEKRLRVE